MTVRRADFLIVLAYATDLATGHSRDFATRSCALAMRFAKTLGLDTEAQRNVYHQALLRHAGCNADTHLLAAAFGDEIVLHREYALIDRGDITEIRAMFVRALTRTFPNMSAEEITKAVSEARTITVPVLAGCCEVAQMLAARLGLSLEACENLGQPYERWDGLGLPHGLKGDAVRLPVRVVALAQDAIVLTEEHGFDAMIAMIKKRRGTAYDPALADIFLAHAKELMAGLDEPVGREAVLALEPLPHAVLDEKQCDEAYLAIADMIDMRMPFTFGHSRAVA